MTLQKAVDIFNVLLDKYGSPNVVDSEAVDFINIGINEVLNRLFPDSQGGVINFEFDSNTLANIQPLIWNLTGLSMSATGVVTDTVINSSLQTATSDGAATYFRISALGYTTDGYPVKFMKSNNRWSFQRNVFKRPSTTNPKFSLVANGIQLYPTDVTKTLSISVIKKPKVLTTSDLASSLEFGDYLSYNIIALALKAAAIPLRDEELIQDARMSGLQITQ